MNPELVNALNRLHQKRQSVSVATLKAQLTVPLPMPQLIAAIKAYKADPETVLSQACTVAPTPEKSNENALEQRVAELEKQLKQLMSRVARLEQR